MAGVVLVDMGCEKHFRVRHAGNGLAGGVRHISGMGSFWAYAKNRMVEFNGVSGRTFYWHLKETEFRFNHRHDNLYAILLEMSRNMPLD
ncbi:hypothetical protein C7N83_00960 [Neisseria iguanae]|uniref:ISXO2-like transposase domain-containing protein n=1 Tax=Neisseria iguanae TaxID=90242 RepID=A0A2P7U330_9NEIS|nr:hypothetical protein C7N83_00960 [Neisseria iguanae]